MGYLVAVILGLSYQPIFNSKAARGCFYDKKTGIFPKVSLQIADITNAWINKTRCGEVMQCLSQC
ncbi:hypothetical protein HZS80_15875 [Halomonas glaciei]|uniref:Uncharacterized protein n=2 Tax=Vreelandella TaxID=3137766 RepID=A0A7Z0LV11_9GAMM|nr:hypothetical protein [Halomonas glaciei]NYS79175.1 hypothetical protein [Halomonas glaciei]|tara:strand:- start:941 stop:1135 length:195 start_codon:yes stop_codon:yes gene_type:complete